ncbi:MAG: phosphoribosylglycinamide formyltransferase [Candidatus Eisenbacteria bacterium]|nr:phosphoribosylglycinamide formyltransferase [Candidatus Eisenbacteria bacterium]
MNGAGYPRPGQLPAEPRTLGLVVLISGGGTTMANLADRIAAGHLDARIELVVSSRDRVAGLARAQTRGLPTIVLPRRAYTRDDVFDVASYTEVLLRMIAPLSIDLIVLGGFMSQIGPALLDRYAALNIHPALLPRHGGPGMYGHHVHEAVLAAGDAESGCTVHFLDPDYDHGPILAQRRVPVLLDDTPDTLAERVQEAERELYPEAIGLIAAGRVRVDAGRVLVV